MVNLMTVRRSTRSSPTTPRSAERHTSLGRHAIVVGGSIAGLTAARVLADFFDEVTVLERDRYPDHAQHRAGIPQASHLHALLARGLEAVEDLFPGIKESMVESGAIDLDSARDFAWSTRAGWGVRFTGGVHMLAFSRPLLDWHVRDRVRRIPNVRIVDGCEVIGLVTGPTGRVAGLKARHRSESKGEPFELSGDLVIDASGRNSRTPEWLKALGVAAPEETIVDASIGYTSRIYKRPKDLRADWKAMFIQIAAPQDTRGGLLFPIEGDRWLVTLNGGGGDYPPTDPEGFVEFARTLRSPLLYEAIRGAEPLTNPVGYRNTENRRRHYERLGMPDRFIVMGDGACAFNPVYGQGMTTAMLGTLALRSALRERASRGGGLDGFARSVQRSLANANAVSWKLATGEDYRYEQVKGAAPGLEVRFMHRYVDRILALTTYDIEVRKLWSRVIMMLDPPTAIFRLSIVAKVLFSRRPRTVTTRVKRLVVHSQDPIESA
jgi:2-polyprenyl-6-methoxyphenol hydroxylase-like FAD-dependent oxidoreductase